MLNIRCELRNLRTNQTHAVGHTPPELAKLQIKGEFNIKFPFGFNRGISADKVKFVKAERQLLLNDYDVWGASANWELSIFYGNLPQPLVVVLDFTDVRWDSVSLEIGFKITPLLDRLRNFEKTNEFISFVPQSFTLKTITPQNFQAKFNHNSLSTSSITIANLQSDGLIDADGLEYNFPIPDKNDAIAIFRVTQKTASQTASYFSLDIDFKYLYIKMWELNGTITLRLKTDYLFYYSDNTYEYSNIIQDSCSSAVLYTQTEVRIFFGNLPKNVELSELPSNPLKTLAECYIVTYLEIDAPLLILQNAIQIWSNHIFVSHNFIQIDEIYKGVRVSDYLQKVNQLAGGKAIFDESLLFTMSDIVISSTNFMKNFNQFLPGKLMDILEALSICAGFSFVEVDGKYVISTINSTSYFASTIELSNFSDVNYEPIEQIIDFEIGDETEVEFQMLPRLFEKRKYYLNAETSATLDALTIKPKIITSGELITNKLIQNKNDDNLLFLKIEQVNHGSFGTVLNQYFSNQNVINRLEMLLNSFFTNSVNKIYYRNNQNQIISHDLSSTNRLFAKCYRNITTPIDNSVISSLFSSYKKFKIGNAKYLPVKYSMNLEPNSINIKLLELIE
jgi:hypothetical protein